MNGKEKEVGDEGLGYEGLGGEGLGGENEMVRSEGIEGYRNKCADNCQYCYGVILNVLM